jgi:plastocyanin
MKSGFLLGICLAAATRANATGYQGGEVVEGGTITGAVRLNGPAPKPESFRIGKDENVCGSSKISEEIAVGKDNALRNIVVWIEGITRGKKANASTILTVDQKACSYTPRVQAAVVNSRVRLVNSDSVLHNVHGYREKASAFNVAMPFAGMKMEQKLDRPGVLELRCDAGHVWMRAWVHVFEHPYFAVTGDDGKFRIDAVPPGKYRVAFWHERLGKIEKEVEVRAKGEVRVEAELKEQ